MIEELARVYGYDRLPSTLLSGELPPQRNNRALQLENTVRDLLATFGLRESVCYSLTSSERETLLGETADHVELLNPISPERAFMRRTLLGNLLEVVEHNLKQTNTVKVFELGAVFLPRAGQKLPEEQRRLAFVLTGRTTAETWGEGQPETPKRLDFYAAKGIVEQLLTSLHVGQASYAVAKNVPYLHPARAANLSLAGQVLGAFGELHPKIAATLKLTGTVLVGEFNLDLILQQVPERYPFKPTPLHQAATRDLAVVVEETLTNEAIINEIRAAGGELLASARLFDLYKGESIPSGKKSLAYALTYQTERTLTDKEIEKAHKKIEDRLKHVLKATQH